jgi:molybdate transport system regulatory protein
MVDDSAHLKIKLQFLAGDDIAMGPGKAELLEWLEQTGSISAAAKAMGVSYRRAWMLVDTMNRCFAKPLVETAHGGAKGGGARVTEAGRAALADYRRAEAAAQHAAKTEAKALLRRVTIARP